MSGREKFNSISDYCKRSGTSMKELKENILETALNMGEYCESNFDGYQEMTRQAFHTLFLFNVILDDVK